ncbi:BatA domain-containing protein [Asticcacaulis sp. BYS171W]|uniref:BatA domain-containing protein n=1 Tax=Asticcacaulis aquaticus TaxID=2984212 RepID=A0ABT5HYP0_9CAUL|nr:BatA domain-containing protein [Asticcacaulis aquaticus]MDC7684561.1 BatA domain-containing protein [Asticcacaulis aquaticus]
MPGLLFPLGLAALTAVILPLVIHLMRRDEARPVMFAALRWLQAKPKPRQRIQFSEWPLLLMRLVLLILLALFLARPVLNSVVDRTPYVAVMPGLDPKTIGSDNVRLHWLAPDFPSTDSPAPKAPADFTSLIRHLDADLPKGVKLTIVVPETPQGADAERPILSREVDWRVMPGAMPAPQPVAARPLALSMRAATDQPGARYFRAAAAAWEGNATTGTLTDPLPPKDTVLVWLNSGPLPDAVTGWIKTGGTIIVSKDVQTPKSNAQTVLWRDDVGGPLIDSASLGKGRWLRFTRPLIPAEMPELLEPDFPDQLKALLTTPPAPSRVAARDYAPLTGRPAFAQAAIDLQPWLAVLVALVFGLERWLATSSRRRAAP